MLLIQISADMAPLQDFKPLAPYPQGQGGFHLVGLSRPENFAFLARSYVILLLVVQDHTGLEKCLHLKTQVISSKPCSYRMRHMCSVSPYPHGTRLIAACDHMFCKCLWTSLSPLGEKIP